QGDEELVKRLVERIAVGEQRLERLRAAAEREREMSPSNSAEPMSDEPMAEEPMPTEPMGGAQQRDDVARAAAQVDAWIEEAYLRTLSRWPTDDERDRCREFFGTAENQAAGLEGVMWVLINTKEFLVNH
ncbi:MAG: hypothetical protein R3B96_20255, partial [Pirellulaceae bacterium]